jgi:hypothetical protein
VPSSINGGSEVASVFNMGTEKYMGSEKHYMSENFEYAASNAGMSSGDGNARLQGLFKKPKRVDKRKEGPVKLMYTGKETTPVESKATNKLKSKRIAYAGATSYTEPVKTESMVSELEINKSSRLNNYSQREGTGIPLKQGDNDFNKVDTDEGLNNISLFTLMKSHEEEKVNRLRTAHNITDGISNMKLVSDLETITEEKTKSDAFTESKITDKDISQEDQSNRNEFLSANTSNEVTLNDSVAYYPFPSGDVLKELHKEDLIKKLLYDSKNPELSNSNNTNLSYQEVLQMSNKIIPPIMKSLFSEDLGEHQSTQHMAYADMPGYGYNAPSVPYQMYYPPPGLLRNNMGLQNKMVHPNSGNTQTPEAYMNQNSKNTMNMQNMNQPRTKSDPVYKNYNNAFVDSEAKYAQNNAFRYQQQMAYHNQQPQGYYENQYAPPQVTQMQHYYTPHAQNMPYQPQMNEDKLIPNQTQNLKKLDSITPYRLFSADNMLRIMTPNNQYPPQYQYPGYMQQPQPQYYQQEQKIPQIPQAPQIPHQYQHPDTQNNQ